MIKISDMPSKKAKRVMTELIPYIDKLHNNAVAIEAKQALERDGFTFLEFMDKVSPIALDDGLQDKIVSIVTEKPLAQVQKLPMNEYMEALNAFSLKDLFDFFGWWLVIIKQV